MEPLMDDHSLVQQMRSDKFQLRGPMSQTTQTSFSIKPLPDISWPDEIEEKLDDALDKSFPASARVFGAHSPYRPAQVISETSTLR
jgi:hypothetical protein